REAVRNDARQLLGNVRIHPVSVGPRRFRGIDVEAGAQAEIVAVALTRKAEATGARIRHHDGKPKFGGDALRAGLHDEILFGAGKARKPIKHRNAAGVGLRRKKYAKAHRGSRFLRWMRVHALNPAEATVLRDWLDRCFRHARCWITGNKIALGRGLRAQALVLPVRDASASGRRFMRWAARPLLSPSASR